ERLDRMADALQFSFDVGGGRDIAVGKVTEIEFYPALEAPFERNLVDRPGALPLVHRRMAVPGRVEMRAVVGRQLHAFDRPPLPVRQILLLETRKERQDLRQTLLVIDVLDLRAEPGRVGRDVVLQRSRNVDQFAAHPLPPCSSVALARGRAPTSRPAPLAISSLR